MRWGREKTKWDPNPIPFCSAPKLKRMCHFLLSYPLYPSTIITLILLINIYIFKVFFVIYLKTILFLLTHYSTKQAERVSISFFLSFSFYNTPKQPTKSTLFTSFSLHFFFPLLFISYKPNKA